MEEALADLNAHWDSLEESKAKKRPIETWFQGQSRLDESMEEIGCRSAKTKSCMANLALVNY